MPKQSFRDKSESTSWLQYRGTFSLDLSIRSGNGCERRRLSLLRQHILQPVAIYARGRRLPRPLQRPRRGFRKERQLFFAWIDESSLLELSKKLDRLGIKVSVRHRGVRFAFAP